MTTARKLSDGAVQLRKALRPQMNQAGLAERLKVSQQAVSAWVNGAARPSPDKMAELEELLGIPMRAWTGDSDGEADESGPHAAVDVDKAG